MLLHEIQAALYEAFERILESLREGE